MKRSLFVLGLFLAIAAQGTVQAQDGENQEPVSSAGQTIAIPKPGPEHEILRQAVGVWDATVELRMQPGAKPEVSKGVETNTAIAGGLWLIQDFKGEFMGAPYHGHSVLGFDPVRKRYVGTWVDSMSPRQTLTEGVFDPKTRTLTSRTEVSSGGKATRSHSTTEWKDPNTRIFTLFSSRGTGEEYPMMTITYRRRPSETR